MQRTSLLLMVVGGILSACIAYDSSIRYNDDPEARRSAGVLRHAAGSFCPPRLAMKGHC